jgi:hypothetical protein
MTIYGLLKNTTFGPEEIERLVPAYEQTLRALGLKDRSDPITQLVAEKIIAVGRLGMKTRRRFPSWLLKSWEIEAADSPLCSLLNISPPIALWRETA